MIPEEYGGSGLGLTAASVIMEEINRCGGNAGAVPRPDVQHGHAAAQRQRRTEAKYLPAIAAGTLRIQSMAVTEPTTGTDTTKIKTTCGEKGRSLRRQRPEGVDLARPAFRPDDPARAHDAARRRQEEIRRHVDVHRRPARRNRPRTHGAADRQPRQSRDERTVLRQPGDSGRESRSARRVGASSTSSTASTPSAR